MPLHTIMFYGGSILHEKATDDTERQIKNSNLNKFYLKYPPPEEGDWILSEQQQQELKRAQEADGEMLETYNGLLLNYDAHQYLRCIHEHLAEFLAPLECCTYLLQWEKRAIAEGRKEFFAHQPGLHRHIRRRDTDEEVERKVGRAKRVGAFARSASVVNPARYQGAPLDLPPKIWFVRTRDGYDVVPAGKPSQKGPSVVLEDANKSSVVLLDDMNQFIEDMVKADLGFPAFTVSDCNSFHTSGYMWAHYALRMARGDQGLGDDEPVLFLNFDQHTDAGKVGDTVASDRWGQPALSQVRNGMYMSFGCGAMWQAAPQRGLGKNYQWSNVFGTAKDGKVSEFKIAEAKKIADNDELASYLALSAKEQFQYVAGILASLSARWDAGTTPKTAFLNGLKHAGGMKAMRDFNHDLQNLDLRQIFSEFWLRFSQYLGKDIKYVFVTVDRDSIQGHQTQWGDFSLFPNAYSLYHTISSVVDPVFEVCPNARLIGFDITGLPESRVVYDVRTELVTGVEEAWEEMMDELTLMYQWSRQRIAPHPKLVNLAASVFQGLYCYDELGWLKAALDSDARGAIRLFRTKLNGFMDGSSSEAAKAIFTIRNRETLQSICDKLNEASQKEDLGKMKPHILRGYANNLAMLLELTAVYGR